MAFHKILVLFYALNTECLFGRAPFASRTFKELENKIWDSKPVEASIHIYFFRTHIHVIVFEFWKGEMYFSHE